MLKTHDNNIYLIFLRRVFMARKNINIDVVESIGTAAAHKKMNGDDAGIDKTKTKTKTIVLPEFWEKELFNNIKNKTFSGTWQGFIREAVREKLISQGIDFEQL